MKKRLTTIAAGAFLLTSVGATAWAQEAKQLYDKGCTSCHGPAGKGDGPAGKALKVKPKDFATMLKGKADADIAKFVKEGSAKEGFKHPASKLTDDQIKSLVDYIKTLQ